MIDFKFIRTADKKIFGNKDANDIQFLNGDIETISDVPYARQQVVKTLMSRLGQNAAFKGYGSDLQRLRHASLNKDAVQAVLLNTIVYALSYLRGVESSEEPNERVQTIQSIDMNFIANDPRQLVVNVTLQLESKETLTLFLQDVI